MVASRRRLGFLALFGLIFGLGVGVVSEALGQTNDAAPAVVERYQPGPLGTRSPNGIANLPSGVEELVGLSVLAAFLYGFRASGLARSSGR